MEFILPVLIILFLLITSAFFSGGELAMMALDEYLYDGNQFFTVLPEVSDALDVVFQNEIDVQPAVQFLTDSADLYALRTRKSIIS